MSEKFKNRRKAISQHFICMVAPVVALLFLAPIWAMHSSQVDSGAQMPLEIRFMVPPRWENGCLLLNFDLINRSSAPLYLTKMGPYVDMALDISTHEGETGQAIAWINIYGNSDIITLDTIPLAPSATSHNALCVSPTAWVINLKEKTRREIPVRGKLQVWLSYFPTEEASRRYKEWFITAPSHLVGQPIEPPMEATPRQATTIIPIPCKEVGCKTSCARPPKGIAGEVRPVPDVFFTTPEWGERGKALTNQLARQSQPCLEDEYDPS